MVRWGFSFFLWMMWMSSCPSTIFSLKLPCDSCQKLMDCNVRVYLWVFHSIPLIYMPVLMPVPRFLDYCVLSFDIRKWVLRLFSSLRWFLAILSPSHFHMNFRVSLPISDPKHFNNIKVFQPMNMGCLSLYLGL